MLTVVYGRNENEPDAVENRILDCEEDGDDKEHAVLDALDEVLPSISYFYPTVTRITLETVEGNLTATITEDVDAIVPYLPIPQHLSHISTVPITELRKVETLDMDVDRVKWEGRTFTFKKTGEVLAGTLREPTILDRLCTSPNIIDLKAIVVNRENLIRGFLMPYMYAGNLEHVFIKARRDQGVAEDDDEPVFDWPIRLTWACQIIQGVVDLHAIEAYNGDLKPQNVVLGPAGQAILIDFLPMGFSDEFAAPEVLAKHHDHDTTLESILTGPADVYSLGLVLYAVAQEKAHGVRPPLMWDRRVPCWYRGVVQRCLHLDPAARPSALDVLSLLQQGAS
jgi:serine/threonine protein kinase